MKTFALLTDGVSDQRVLRSVLIGFMQQFDGEDEKHLKAAAPKNPSLNLFVEELTRVVK
ncbi:MAG: hypothetical protein U0414_39530 [Polyangiaceae bacterium]